MKKSLHLLVGVAVAAALAFVIPSPALADHAKDDEPDLPAPPDEEGSPPGNYHEHPPSPAEVLPVLECVVQGEVLPGNPNSVGKPHVDPVTGTPIPGLDATHSHYNFISSSILCPDTNLVGVDATGGNDGHFIEAADYHHDFNMHHGSTNESGWSHSSLYTGGQGGDEWDGVTPFVPADVVPLGAGNGGGNDCNTGPLNKGKGNITVATGDPSTGWVKYLRVGTALYVWGCFTDGTIGQGANPFFSGTLAIVPPSPTGLGNFPQCLLDPLLPPQPPCGFSIAGTAYRGPGWSLDTVPLHEGRGIV